MASKGGDGCGYLQFFGEGTKIKKVFVNPSSGERQLYNGKVASFDPCEGFYMIHYSDGDREELTENQVMMYMCA
jgi:hypothetical protein